MMIPSAAVENPHSSIVEPAVPPRWKEAAFLDQVAYFLERYPAGFQDPLWIKDHRGREATKRLKRHRAPAITEARGLASHVDDWIARGDAAAAVDALHRMLRQTSLAPPGQVRRLQRLSPDQQRRLLQALPALTGDRAAFPAWFEVLGEIGQPAWQLTTAPLALSQPDELAWVRPKLLRQQAQRLGKSLPSGRVATASSYRQFLALVLDLRERCRAADLKPRDLLDVCDFIWSTLRPQARATLAGAHQRRERALASRPRRTWEAA